MQRRYNNGMSVYADDSDFDDINRSFMKIVDSLGTRCTSDHAATQILAPAQPPSRVQHGFFETTTQRAGAVNVFTKQPTNVQAYACDARRMSCTSMRSYAYSTDPVPVVSKHVAEERIRNALQRRGTTLHRPTNEILGAYEDLFSRLIRMSTESALRVVPVPTRTEGAECAFSAAELERLLLVYEDCIDHLADSLAICHLACTGLHHQLEQAEGRARNAEHALERIKDKIQTSVDMTRHAQGRTQ